MSNRKKEWLNHQKKTGNYLDPAARAALVREAFTGFAAAVFTTVKDECRKDVNNAMRSVEDLREACFRELDAYWPEYQAMSAKSSDDELYAVVEKFTELAEARGLLEWRAVAFERVAADPGKQWRDDGCSADIPWEKVSAQNKASYLSLQAATYDVSYERFAEAVKDTIGGRELAAQDHKSLRGQFEAARKLLAPIEPEASPELENSHSRER